MQFEPSEAVRHWATYAPDSIALVLDERELSYACLDRDVNHVAHCIAQQSPKDRRIATLCSSKYKLLVAILATVRLGKSAVILHPHDSADILRRCLHEASARSAIVDHVSISQPNLQQALSDCNILNFDTVSPARSEPVPRLSSPSPQAEWGVFYSSGTTGLPKGIARDQYSVVVELLGWCLELQLTAHTSFFMGRPIFYTGGLILVLSTLLAGGTVVLPSDVSWQAYQDALEHRPIDLAFFIPTQLRQFIEEARKAKTDPRFARTILVMGEVISGQEKTDANRLLKSDIIESWGNTEGLGTITRPRDLQDCPDSIGRPFLTDLMFVVDEAGQVLPSGRVGRLAGAVEAGFTEYCGRPDETRSTKRNDILISDDLGYVDERGMFYVLGRTDEVIEAGEGLVVLPDLESQFRSLGLTKELCMVPLTRDPDLTFAVAVVPLDDRAPNQPEELLEILNQRCPPHVRITEVRFFHALPLTATGKIMRHELASRFMERPP